MYIYIYIYIYCFSALPFDAQCTDAYAYIGLYACAHVCVAWVTLVSRGPPCDPSISLVLKSLSSPRARDPRSRLFDYLIPVICDVLYPY